MTLTNCLEYINYLIFFLYLNKMDKSNLDIDGNTNVEPKIVKKRKDDTN